MTLAKLQHIVTLLLFFSLLILNVILFLVEQSESSAEVCQTYVEEERTTISAGHVSVQGLIVVSFKTKTE